MHDKESKEYINCTVYSTDMERKKYITCTVYSTHYWKERRGIMKGRNTPQLFTLLKGKYDGKERKDYPCTIYSTEREVWKEIRRNKENVKE